MIVYQTDAEGFLVAPVEADESPLEPGVYLVPRGCVEPEPPALSAGERARWTGEAWEVVAPPEPEPEPEPAAPTIDDVIAERDRRLALGFDYDFGDVRGVHRIGTTPGDMRGWDEVTKIALARQALGSTTAIGIVMDTGPAEVTPLEWLALLEAANGFRQPIWHASFALQVMDPIPADYADDARWP